MPQWFKRFADIPGIEYRPAVAVRRELLPLHDAHPRIEYYQYQNGRGEICYWPTSVSGQGTSRAPAASWETQPLPGKTPAQTALRQLCERLELPGGLEDYHSAIEECCRVLKQVEYVKADPALLNEIERLCWLDVRLVETYPSIITREYNGQVTYFPGLCYGFLIYLFEREGYLREALGVAERQAQFADPNNSVARLHEKIAALEAEDSPDDR